MDSEKKPASTLDAASTYKTEPKLDLRALDAGTVYPNHPKHLDPADLLKFAKQILAGLAVFSVFVIFLSVGLIIGASFCSNESMVKFADMLFDLTKTVITPMITLVLGFYFGRNNA